MAPPNNEFTAQVIVPRETVQQDVALEQEQQQPSKPAMDWEAPAAQGLYDPQNEHEACGVGFICRSKEKPTIRSYAMLKRFLSV